MNGYRYSLGFYGGLVFDIFKYSLRDLFDFMDWRFYGEDLMGLSIGWD